MNALELRLLESRHSYTLMLARLRNTGDNDVTGGAKSIVERGAGVGAENPSSLGPIIASQLPRPAIDFLERYREVDVAAPMEPLPPLADSIIGLTNKRHFDYNPYDLTYLNDITDVTKTSDDDADSDGSEASSGDASQDYIQDF